MRLLNDFINRFNASIGLDEELMAEKQNRYFLLNKSLKRLISKDFFYAGVYLGKARGKVFFPSFCLLTMMAKGKANKIMVDKRTEWLFICGRDIFRQGVKSMIGSRRRGDYALILNQYDECLGFGRILCNLDEDQTKHKVAVKNISDIGDFLRRERRSKTSES